jgi:hypothetical protein
MMKEVQESTSLAEGSSQRMQQNGKAVFRDQRRLRISTSAVRKKRNIKKIKRKKISLMVVNSTYVNKCTGVEVDSTDINPWTYVVICATGWLGFSRN